MVSLRVSVFQCDGDGGRRAIVLGPGRDLAGFEVWRTNVWGSRHVRRLGLRILPELDRRDLRVRGEELDALAAEVDLLTQHLMRLVPLMVADGDVVSNADPHETVRTRLDNIAHAIEVARALPANAGELVIW
jgi:hypothetical protein